MEKHTAQTNHAHTNGEISEARLLYNFLKQAPGIVAILKGPDHVFEYANPPFIELVRNPDVTGKPAREALPEYAGQPFFDLLDHVYRTGERYNGNETPFTREPEKGRHTTVYLNFIYQAFKNDEGETEGILVFATEVTEQVMSRKKIEEKEEQLRMALEAGELGTFDFYPQTGELSWSAKAKELFGLPPEADISYETYLNGLHPDDKEANNAAAVIDKQNKQDGHYEIEYRTIGITDGKLRWIRTRGKVISDDQGNAIRITGVMQDTTQQNAAEEELKRFKHMADNATEPFILMREDASFAYLNDVALKRWGYTREEAENLYVPDVDLVYNEHKFNSLFAAAQKRDLPQFETLHKKKNGTIFPVEVNVSGLTLEGKPRLFAVARDVSDRKNSEHILKYRTALLEAQNEAIPDAILIVDTKGKMLSFNQHFIDLWHMPDDIIKRKDDTSALQYAMTQLTDPDGFIERVNYCYAHPDENAHEEVLFKDGRIIERYGNAVIGEGGISYGWAWYFRDITERKNFEIAIRESEERFRMMADAMPQKVWTADEDNQINYFNKQWLDYTQLGFNELKEMGWQKIVHTDDRDAYYHTIKRAIDTREDFEIEHRLLRYDQTYRWHLSRGHVLKDENGKIKLWIGTNTDIHEQKLFAEELKKQVADRIKLEKQKNEFISMASHELKTPVTSIKGYAQVLQYKFKAEGNAEAEAFVVQMDKQINKLSYLINDLLDATKVTSGRLKFNEEPFAFNELVVEIVNEMQQTTQTHTISVNLDADEIIPGDRNRIGQVMTNMLSNAIKYSPRADTVIVGTARKNNIIEFCVQDFGIGIPEENQAHVFDQFFRVSGDVQDTFAGLGLGLFIASEIVKRHNGTISVESTEGNGSTFCFTLPVERFYKL